MDSAGTQTAALAFGGGNPSPQGGPTQAAECESWNGSAWTEVNDLNTGRTQVSGAGTTNTAALAFSGYNTLNAETELWNGTSWTEVNDLNTAGRLASGCGSSTAAMLMGRYSPSPSNWDLCEHWNGTSWTEVNDLNEGRYYTGGSGTQGAGILHSGQEGPGTSNMQNTEEFNTSFTVAVS